MIRAGLKKVVDMPQQLISYHRDEMNEMGISCTPQQAMAM